MICMAPSRIKDDESMSQSESTLSWGLSQKDIPSSGSQFQPLNNAEGFFWVPSSGENFKAYLLLSFTLSKPAANTVCPPRAEGRRGGCSNWEREDVGKPADASCWVRTLSNACGPRRTKMLAQLGVAQQSWMWMPIRVHTMTRYHIILTALYLALNISWRSLHIHR